MIITSSVNLNLLVQGNLGLIRLTTEICQLCVVMEWMSENEGDIVGLTPSFWQ